ncbi:MAG: transporter substrate-binding domain-containing protein [Paucibacter sp.]|nr:transporter substrate-binding domain-containing protein [Roseateles sp.]
MSICMRWAVCAIGVLAGCFCASAGAGNSVAAPACRKVVVSADPEFPPYAWYDGKTLRGASVDVVLTVLRTMQLPYELRYAGPFVRLLRSAEQGDVDIITELKRTPEREAFLAFSDTSIFANPTSVFVRAGPEGPAIKDFHGRESLRHLRGGVTRGTRFGDGLDDFIQASLKVEEGPGIRENFLKLQAGRIDYFLSPHYPAMDFLVTSGQETNFMVLKPFVAMAPVFVGWSRRSPCLPYMVEFDARLRRYVAAMDASRVIESSFADWRRAPVMVR